MSVRLKDFIRSIRACKTASEERDLMAKESALIRTALKEGSSFYRHRNMTKLLFIHLMGYPCHFAQIECLKMIASNSFLDKRIGYLGLSQILDEDTETLMLVTNSLKNDLTHASQYINGLALSALGYIGTPEMCRSLLKQIEDLCSFGNPFVQKKAILCAARFIRRMDDIADRFVVIVPSLFEGKNHGVLLAACSLVDALLQTKNEEIIKDMKKQLPDLLSTLKSVMVFTGYLSSTEYNVSGVSDPFLQTKLLKSIRNLTQYVTEVPNDLIDTLYQISTASENVNGSYQIIQLECANTILDLKAPTSTILTSAVNILSRFLQSTNFNIKYVGINSIKRVAKIDKSYLNKYFQTILNCMKDNDPSIQFSSLDLVIMLIKKNNIDSIFNQFISLIKTTLDDSSKIELGIALVSKACYAIENHSPSLDWHFDSAIQLMSLSKYYFPISSWRNFISLISNNVKLCNTVIVKLYSAYKSKCQSFMIIASCLWVFGEFAIIAQNEISEKSMVEFYENISLDLLHGRIPNGYPLLDDMSSLSANLIVSQAKLLESPNISDTADMAKLSDLLVVSVSKYMNKVKLQPESKESLLKIFKTISKSGLSMESDQRCLEFQTLIEPNYEKFHEKIFALMPPINFISSNELLEDDIVVNPLIEDAVCVDNLIELDSPRKDTPEVIKKSDSKMEDLLASIFVTNDNLTSGCHVENDSKKENFLFDDEPIISFPSNKDANQYTVQNNVKDDPFQTIFFESSNDKFITSSSNDEIHHKNNVNQDSLLLDKKKLDSFEFDDFF